MTKKIFPTPSQFYRHRRPENFSDSKIVTKTILPREQLDFELSQISINQKHDSFETLCRRLAEKLISPNLIPQVGPTGGGDGKTDSETYPVSNFISDRWYVNDNKWNEKENWAFAISAKKDWKPKVKSDVKKIVDTNRGYTKIFFFSNQKISSRNKKEIQDQTKLDFSVELIILDAEWILEKVYGNQLVNEVVEALNLSRIYLEEKVTGPRDSERLLLLEELEKEINSSNRAFDIDFKLIEDCLESAILSRMLELPKAEVIGKFERALKFANKLNNIQLKIRVHYQFAWTLINWYDDYKTFYDEFLLVKELVQNEPNISNIEFYLNLVNILQTISNIEEATNLILVDFDNESKDLVLFLDLCCENKNKPSTALLAKFYLAFFQIRKNLENRTSVSEILIKLKEYFYTSKKHLDIPFDQLTEFIDVYNKLLPESSEFDDLIETIAEIESTRTSELNAGQRYLNRGIVKLENNFTKESLIFFGKAARKLAKDETQMEFYYCLMLLSDAYSKLDLYWASYNALIAATNIFANKWYNTGKLHIKFLKSVEAILKNEVIIGRVPVLLCWFELHSALNRYFQQDNELEDNEKITPEHMTDACLAIRLLNLNFKDFPNLKLLPDIFKSSELWLSEDTSLYLLGNVDLIDLDETKTSLRKEDFPQYYNNLANQPFVEQIAYETNFLNTEQVSIESQILGTRLKIVMSKNPRILIVAEVILAYIESFLATSFEEVFPVNENIIINLDLLENIANFKLEVINKKNITVSLNDLVKFDGKYFRELLDELLPQVIGGNYMFRDAKQFFENLYKKDEVNERLSIIVEHYNFITNVITNKPKLFLEDWQTKEVTDYMLLRTESPIEIDSKLQKLPTQEGNEELEDEKKSDFKNVSHKKIKAETVINSELWDNAHWKAFGYFSSKQIPFGLLLSFEDGEYGKKIFTEWINKYGKEDKDEIINITIVKGIDKSNPYWYKVIVSKNVNKDLFSNGNLVSISSRFHKMEATSGVNLENLIKGYERFKKYILIPAHVDTNFNMTPYLELGILKSDLRVIEAWEIGINDIERVVITKDDNPIIPDHIVDAPVLELLNDKNSQKDE